MQVVRGLAGLLIFAALLFGPAGRLDWIEGWAFVGAFLGFSLGLFVWMARRDPGLLAERQEAANKENVKSWDRAIMGVYTALLIALLVVSGLDGGRLRWSLMPTAVTILAWLGFALAASLIWRVMRENTFLSEMVRIQNDRGHRVITTGPYRFVRHPMYVGVILFVLCVPLALGSWWAEIPAVLIAALFVLRTALEDKTLLAELSGYSAYAQQVRYRLIPGVW